MYAYLDGLPSSSTRAELLGLILSLYYPGPVHTALDNSAVVTFANSLIKMLSSDSFHSCCPSFANKSNGDLWSIFWKALVNKGVKSVLVSKTKGHALASLPADATPFDRRQAMHNDRSDHAAKTALHKFYNPNL
eukprot:2871148-Karenia_brevis.AAC.1